ncbi:MAG: tripartite tricarboxylate transporter TctB family protein [Burkholderiaceae bacterium]|jgi:putative tricarboxylic transport membrane protein|nr:tripartite tricarboxylate transporter TctB family protein [Burkholderiaceae bacterium]MDO7716154.1 tripartite tricarboxylate transporter TctB family protein [Burkholderiaceae bacterium]|tara:strand:- start:1526 stop:1957 length:432 start_codon:yes stop_codon:yes gene_type:complete
MSDRIFAFICLALACLMTWGATVIEESFIQDPLGPKVFPLVIAFVLAACGVAMLLRPDGEPIWPTRRKQIQLLWTVGAMVLYVQFLPVVGFLISTAVGAAFLSWQLGATLRQACLGGLSISVGIYVVFRLILGLSLARGPFGF